MDQAGRVQRKLQIQRHVPRENDHGPRATGQLRREKPSMGYGVAQADARVADDEFAAAVWSFVCRRRALPRRRSIDMALQNDPL